MTSASYNSTHRKDRIYGLLGLVDQRNSHDLIVPDYNSDFSDVVVDTALVLIEGTRSFALFSLSGCKSEDTPSWAPQWNRPVIYARHETHFEEYFSHLTEFPGRDAFAYQVAENKRTLHASGVIVAKIVEAHQIPPLETSQDEAYRYGRNAEILRKFETELTERPAFSDCLGNNPRDGLSTLAHVFEGNRFSWTWENDVQRYDALMERLDPAESTTEAKSYFLTALTLVLKEESIFATRDGEGIGRTLIGPLGEGAEDGDSIALFPGCPWPIQLREADGEFRILGPVYLHGFMDMGEQAQVFKERAVIMIPLV